MPPRPPWIRACTPFNLFSNKLIQLMYRPPLTNKHLLIECVDFSDVRQRFRQVPSLQDRQARSGFRLLEGSCAVQTFMKSL